MPDFGTHILWCQIFKILFCIFSLQPEVAKIRSPPARANSMPPRPNRPQVLKKISSEPKETYSVNGNNYTTIGLNDDLDLRNELINLTIKYNLRLSTSQYNWFWWKSKYSNQGFYRHLVFFFSTFEPVGVGGWHFAKMMPSWVHHFDKMSAFYPFWVVQKLKKRPLDGAKSPD